MEGLGRGGRGAALLKALSEQHKPPPGEQSGSDASETSSVPSSTLAPGRPSLGRGQLQMNLQLLQSQMQSQSASAPSPAPLQAVGARPVPLHTQRLGRGISALHALEKAVSSQSLQGARGRGIFQALSALSSASPPASPESAAATPSSPPQLPTEAMAAMAVAKKEPAVLMHGKEGTNVALSANYVRLITDQHKVYQYHVFFTPVIDNKNIKFRLLNEHKETLGPKVFNGDQLFLPKMLEQKETIFTSVRTTDQQVVSINVTFVKEVPPEECQQLYNILFRRIQTILQMVQVGRYFYNPNTPVMVPLHKLKVWPGYITAIKEQEGGLMLLLDSSFRVLRTETVLDIMHSTLQRNPRGFQDEIVKKVVGCIVLTKYNNKTYRIDDILWDRNPNHTFCTSSGQEISFIEYYKKAHGIEINDCEQPLLLHRPKPIKDPQGRQRAEMICLVPELSHLTGLTDELRSNNTIMKDLAAHTRILPMQRHAAMRDFLRSVLEHPEANQQLLNWGLKLDVDNIQITGRNLPAETIIGGRKRKFNVRDADWNREACNNQVLAAVPLKHWAVFFVSKNRHQAAEFAQLASQVTRQMGIEVRNPDMIELRDDRTETFLKQIKIRISPELQMVVVICPSSRDDRYSAIKKLCCVECPVPSQVINSRTLQGNKMRNVCQKVMLQINCKLGGELWAVNIPLSDLMVVGIDVHHDAVNKRKSTVGFVASTNPQCTRWFSRVSIQMPGQEIIDALRICLTASLKKYHEINHKLPSRIVVYRDGVGEGQLDMVKNYEVQQLEECFASFDTTYTPHLTVVVVQKRINTRIFLKAEDRTLVNPVSGTVVDREITQRDRYDFFLVSQHVRQGTVSPTHYVVVHDGSNMKPDHMQRLAYKMTHLYYNWPGTVRVPAPCQYAHKLAYLVGQNIHKEPSALLSDRLFFL